MLTDLALRPT